MIVYLVTNRSNGSRYVGVTSRSLEDRWSEHRHRSKQNAKFKLGRAIQKYGPSAFSVEVLCELDTYDDLLAAESIFIANLGTFSASGYNMTPGGETAPTLVKEIALRGGATRSRTRRGVNHPMYGKRQSPETIEKRRVSLKKTASRPEWRAERAETTRRSWEDPAIRNRRVSASRGVKKGPMSQETKDKLSLAKKGTVVSPSTREKLSRAAREMWAKRKQLKVYNADTFRIIQ
jgi:group I intron endonuclease